MTEKGMENNKVTVIGTIVSGFTFSHAVFGEGFYLVDLLVNRLSEQADTIPLMISERLIDVTKDYRGCTMEASGQFRSYNRHEGTKNRLVLSEKSVSWRSSRIIRRRTRSSWTGTYARSRSTGRPRSEERSRIFSWQ